MFLKVQLCSHKDQESAYKCNNSECIQSGQHRTSSFPEGWTYKYISPGFQTEEGKMVVKIKEYSIQHLYIKQFFFKNQQPI